MMGFSYEWWRCFHENKFKLVELLKMLRMQVSRPNCFFFGIRELWKVVFTNLTTLVQETLFKIVLRGKGNFYAVSPRLFCLSNSMIPWNSNRSIGSDHSFVSFSAPLNYFNMTLLLPTKNILLTHLITILLV